MSENLCPQKRAAALAGVSYPACMAARNDSKRTVSCENYLPLFKTSSAVLRLASSPVKFRVKGIEVAAVKMILHDPECFTEPLIVHDFTLS